MSFCVTHRSALDKNIRHIYSGLPGEIRLRSYGNSTKGAIDVYDRVVEKYKRPPERFEVKFREYVPEYGTLLPRAPAFRTVSPREAKEISVRLSRPTVMSYIRHRSTLSRKSPRRSPSGRGRLADDEDEDQSELEFERSLLRSRERQPGHRRVACKEWSDDEGGFYFEDEDGGKLTNGKEGNKESISTDSSDSPTNKNRDSPVVPDTPVSESTNQHDTTFDDVYTDDNDDDTVIADDANTHRDSPVNQHSTQPDTPRHENSKDKVEAGTNKSRNSNKKPGSTSSTSPRSVGNRKYSNNNYQRKKLGILEEIMKTRVVPRKRKPQPVFTQPANQNPLRKSAPAAPLAEKENKKLDRRARLDNRLGNSPYQDPMPRVLIVYHSEKPQIGYRKSQSDQRKSYDEKPQGPHERGSLTAENSTEASEQSRPHTRAGTTKDKRSERKSRNDFRLIYPPQQPSRSRSAPSRAIRMDRLQHIRESHPSKKSTQSKEGEKRKDNWGYHNRTSKYPCYRSDFETFCVVQTQLRPGKPARFASSYDQKKSNTRLQKPTTSKIIRDRMRWAPDNDKNLSNPVKVVQEAIETEEMMKKQRDRRGRLDEGEHGYDDEEEEEEDGEDESKEKKRNERGEKGNETVEEKTEDKKIGKKRGKESTQSTSTEPMSSSSTEDKVTIPYGENTDTTRRSSSSTSSGSRSRSPSSSRSSSPRSPPNSPRSTIASQGLSQVYINRLEGSSLTATQEDDDHTASSESQSPERGVVKEKIESPVSHNIQNGDTGGHVEAAHKRESTNDDEPLSSSSSATITGESSESSGRMDDGRAVAEQERGRLDHVVPVQNSRGDEFGQSIQKSDVEDSKNSDVTFTDYQVARHTRGNSLEGVVQEEPTFKPAEMQGNVSYSTSHDTSRQERSGSIEKEKADISYSTNNDTSKHETSSNRAEEKADVSYSTNNDTSKHETSLNLAEEKTDISYSTNQEVSKQESSATVTQEKELENEYSSEFSEDSSTDGEYSLRSNDEPTPVR